MINLIDCALGPKCGIAHTLDVESIQNQSIRFLKRVKDHTEGPKAGKLRLLLRIAAAVFIQVLKQPNLNFCKAVIRDVRVKLKQKSWAPAQLFVSKYKRYTGEVTDDESISEEEGSKSESSKGEVVPEIKRLKEIAM